MNVVLFNLYAGGHHGQHVIELVRAWKPWANEHTLHAVVTQGFVEKHPDVATEAEQTPGVHLHLVEPFPRPRSLVAWDVRHGLEARRWAKRLHAHHLVFLYLDHAQLSLSTFLRGGTTAYSGIHFRPSFHYGEIGSPSLSAQETLSRWRKRALLQTMLTNPSLHTLFELDEYAVPAIRRLRPRRDVAVHLPEPLSPFSTAVPSPLLSQVEPGRRSLVLFGALDERKGLLVMLEALLQLRADEQERVALVLAGKLVQPELRPRINAFRQNTQVQLLFEDRFLNDVEIQPLLGQADLNLVPYVGHVGSSGILVRTATAGKPVLATNFGLVGAHVRRNGLGRAVDTWTPEPLSQALSEWLEDPTTIPFDADKAQAFADSNTAAAFASTLFGRLLRPAS